MNFSNTYVIREKEKKKKKEDDDKPTYFNSNLIKGPKIGRIGGLLDRIIVLTAIKLT